VCYVGNWFAKDFATFATSEHKPKTNGVCAPRSDRFPVLRIYFYTVTLKFVAESGNYHRWFRDTLITYLLHILLHICAFIYYLISNVVDARGYSRDHSRLFILSCSRALEMIYLFFPDFMYLYYSTLLSRARSFDVSMCLHYAGKTWQREMFDILGRYVRSTTFMGVPSKLRAAKRKIMPVIWSRKYVYPRALWRDRVGAEIHR